MYKEMEIEWRDLRTGDVLPDGSVVIQKHAEHVNNCIRVRTKDEDFIVSEDHLLLVDVRRLPRRGRAMVMESCLGEIVPLQVDYLIYSHDCEFLSNAEKENIFRSLEDGTLESSFFDKYEVQEILVKDEPKIFDRNRYMVWLTALETHRLMLEFPGCVYSGHEKILSTEYVGELPCFCISTNTGRYRLSPNLKCDLEGLESGEYKVVKSYKAPSSDKLENMSCKELLNECEKFSGSTAPVTYPKVLPIMSRKYRGVIHHNSVTIRNIIFHCLTHGIKIGLVDLKITEFEEYKGHANVIGVANNVEEACELLRLARQLMYRRNKELAKAGVVDLLDYKPKKKTNRIAVFGREFDEKDKLMVKDEDGNEREITFGELESMLKN